MFDITSHSTATGEGFFYSDHYTPEEIVERISNEMTLDVRDDKHRPHYATGKQFKITITVEQTND